LFSNSSLIMQRGSPLGPQLILILELFW